MAQSSKTFRIFVSSTFSDLKEERNALQKYVFPRLRDLCMQHSCRFQAIDLRWGVSEEAGLDQQTMKICLEEIARCQKTTIRPNFIVLLGDRYGWCPLPAEIPEDEFRQIIEKVTSDVDKKLITQWYNCDENAVPPVYCLKERVVIIGDDATDDQKKAAQEKEFEEWGRIEKDLRSILTKAIDQLGWQNDDHRRVKYEASATEQEINQGALKPSDAKKHVFCFFRKINGLPQNISAKDFCDIDNDGNLDDDAQSQLHNLKTRLCAQLPGNVSKYNANWTDKGLSTYHIGTLPEKLEDCLKLIDADTIPSGLCVDVWKKLSKVIKEEIAQFEDVDALEKEIDNHNEFGKERARFFVGRDSTLEKISDYVKGTDTRPLTVFGVSGSGKSALMARAFELVESEHKDAEVIVRFIGATPESSDGRALLESLCRQISRRYGADESTIPNDYMKLVEELPKRLSLATFGKSLFLFLDALDQLSNTDNANNLTWIPRELPQHVHLVVSTLYGEEKKLSSSIQIELEKMLHKDGNELLDLWLKDAKRSLQEDQEKEVLNKFEKSGLPLYLKLAFEEARRWKSYGGIPLGSSGKQGLSQDVPGIIRDMFSRLSSESNHGNILVSRSMGYLAASKNGLTEDEMLDVLSEDDELYLDFLRRARHIPSEKKLPVVVWSRLYFDLEPYLTQRSADGTSLMAFFHRQLGEVAAREYYSGHMKQYFHRALSNYFTGQPLQSATCGLKSPNVRKVSELPYQQTLGQMWDELIGTLTEFTFTIAKCAADKVDELENDYDRAVTEIPVPSKVIEMWKAFFQERIHILRRSKKYWPAYKIFLQLAVEHADDSPITLAAEAWLQKGNCDWVWFKRKQRLSHVQLSRCLITIEEQTAVEGAIIWPEGRLISWSGDNELKVWDTKTGALKVTLIGHADRVAGALKLSNGMLASWSNDDTLRIWNVETGELKTTLLGHTGSIKRALELLDGYLLSWSEDKTLRVWDVTTGELKTTFEDHTRPIYGALELPDGFIVSWDGDNKLRIWNIRAGNLQASLINEGKVNRTLRLSSDLIVVWGDNNTLRVWDIEKGELKTTLEGHTKSIYAALELSNKRLISWSYDNTLRVWDIETGKTEIMLEGHTKSVWGAVELSNDRLVSWGGDDTLRIWNLKDGNSLAILEGHKLMIQGALELPNGRLVSWAYDNTLRVWDQKGDLQFVLEGHCDFIYGALLLLDKYLVSWGNDTTIRIWNIEGEEHKSALRCHADRVKGMLLLSDGRVVSWADDLIGDPDLLVWDISGDLISTFKGHLDGITGAMRWSDKRLISWSYDKTLKVWDLETNEVHTTLTGHKARISGALAWSDRLVVSWAHDETLRVWEVENGDLKLTLEGHTLPVEGALKLSDGRLLSWSLDNSLKIWNVETGKIVTNLDAHTKRVIGAMELSDGQLVSWAEDNTLIVWDVNTGKSKVKLEGHKKKVWKVLELSNGSLVSWTGDPLSGKNDHELYIWDVNTGDLKVTLEGHTGWVEGVIELSNGSIMSWTSEGNVINDHTLRVWNLKTGECLLTISKEEAPFLYPDLLAARAAADPETRLVSKADFVGWAVGSISGISSVYAGTENIPLWHAESLSVPRVLLDNGTFIVSEKNGQVCFLELHHGNRSINLDELKGMLKNG
jgi:WD40 repeat protein